VSLANRALLASYQSAENCLDIPEVSCCSMEGSALYRLIKRWVLFVSFNCSEAVASRKFNFRKCDLKSEISTSFQAEIL